MPRQSILRSCFSSILAALLLLAELYSSQPGFAQQASAQPAQYDFIISGGHVVDGTGAPWVAADIGITGDRIAAIGDLSKASAPKRVNATSLVVSPGFTSCE